MKGQYLMDMLILATQRHAGQYDKAGEPYILHLLAVMNLLHTDDEELQCIALGHDLIEDTFGSIREGVQFLQKRGFSARIVRGIADISKVPGEDYEAYKDRVKSNPDTVKVKKADLQHNSDLSRLKSVSPKDRQRTNGYLLFLDELEAILNPPRCACCGTTENLHRDYGSGGPWRCDSLDCTVF